MFSPVTLQFCTDSQSVLLREPWPLLLWDTYLWSGPCGGNWSWGGFALLIAGVIFLMDQSNNIWISYTCFTLFKTFYLRHTAICTFQIAKTLSRRRYALVFRVNSFVATVLQSVLTATVINTKPLKLTITSQCNASSYRHLPAVHGKRCMYCAPHEESLRMQPGRDSQRQAGEVASLRTL